MVGGDTEQEGGPPISHLAVSLRHGALAQQQQKGDTPASCSVFVKRQLCKHLPPCPALMINKYRYRWARVPSRGRAARMASAPQSSRLATQNWDPDDPERRKQGIPKFRIRNKRQQRTAAEHALNPQPAIISSFKYSHPVFPP